MFRWILSNVIADMYIRAYHRYVQPNITGDYMKKIKISKTGISKILAAAVVAIVAVAAIGGVWYYTTLEPEETVLKVFCAGSLTLPFEDVEAQFEADNPNVDVQLEPAGSVACVQKITETGEECDVLASADYSLIPSMMMTAESDYADWYIIFAVNRMTLAYTDNSRYADEVTADNWYDILRRSDVKWGFSNPNLDPCGYRSPMVIQLAEIEYGDDMIFEDLIEANSAITVSEDAGTYLIDANMTDLNPNTDRLMIRDKSVELVTFVQEGGLDYAFEYSSVAKQHGLKYLELPASIDLSSTDYENLYKTVKIEKTTTTSTGAPIVYGLTIPKNAPNPALAEEFVKYTLNDFGQTVFNNNGQPPVVPALADDVTKVPQSLQSYVVKQPEETTPELPELSLSLVALHGTETVLDESDIAEFPSIEYTGGLMTSSGSIQSIGTYTGVPLSTLYDMIGGITNETTVRVTASDDYSMVFTYDQLTSGEFITFDPVTGDEVEATKPLSVVLAYFCDGAPLVAGDGPLRLVAIGSEGLITEGHYWVKCVVKIEIREAQQDWTLTLNGSLVEEVNRVSFEMRAQKHPANWTDADSQLWTGMPLTFLLGRVDDSDPKSFNQTLADEGYTVTVIASDGYSIELNSTFISQSENILVADLLDDTALPGKYWPLRLVGSDLDKSQMIRNIAEIRIIY
jgi:molybdate/tungstate transport system substrate-binding protein